MEQGNKTSYVIGSLLGINILIVSIFAYIAWQGSQTIQQQNTESQKAQQIFFSETLSGYQAFLANQESDRRAYEQKQTEQIAEALKTQNISDHQALLAKSMKDHQAFLQKQEADRRSYETQKEYEKVGGKENFELIQKYQVDAINQEVKKFTATQEEIKDESNSVFDVPMSTVKSMLAQSTIIKGPSSPDILLVEYMDPECPFCQRQYHDQTIDQLISYNSDLSIGHTVRPVTGANHTNTTTKGYALICADQIAGHAGVREILDSAFADMTQSTTQMISRTSLSTSQMDTCIGDSATTQRFADNNSEFDDVMALRGGGRGGTPTTLILNTKTGKATLVEGAYPLDHFSEALKRIIQ